MGVQVICPDCGKRVSGRVPKGGDGTAWYPRFHRAGLAACGGRFATVWDLAPPLPSASPASASLHRLEETRPVLHLIEEEGSSRTNSSGTASPKSDGQRKSEGGPRRKETPPEIRAERQRQTEVEGWTPEHDAEHEPGHLLRAAVYYLWHGDPVKGAPIEASGAPVGWPWEPSCWKPKDRRSNLIRAGALCLAERDAIVARQGNGHRGVAHVYQKLDIVIRELAALSSKAQPVSPNEVSACTQTPDEQS